MPKARQALWKLLQLRRVAHETGPKFNELVMESTRDDNPP